MLTKHGLKAYIQLSFQVLAVAVYFNFFLILFFTEKKLKVSKKKIKEQKGKRWKKLSVPKTALGSFFFLFWKFPYNKDCVYSFSLYIAHKYTIIFI